MSDLNTRRPDRVKKLDLCLAGVWTIISYPYYELVVVVWLNGQKLAKNHNFIRKS